MQKSIFRALSLMLVVGVALVAYLTYRNKMMERLYDEAMGYPEFFRGTGQSTDAVRRLSAYRGRRATEMLLDVAMGRGPFMGGDTQTEAIKALSKRPDPEVSHSVANLLQPHEGLETRQAAATALQGMACDQECISSVLHYLERIWRGEPNLEDRFLNPPSLKDLTASLANDQQKLYESLYSVLRRQKSETVAMLKQVYGLGSDAPSPFALDILSRVGIPEACPYLLQTAQELQQLPEDAFRAPRRELQVALSSLKCK